MRLRSDIWVAAYLRRIHAEGGFAALRRRGAAEAGAIFVVVDRLDGHYILFSPGPADPTFDERRWVRAHSADTLAASEIDARLGREIVNDPDAWIIEIESKDGESRLDLANLLTRR